MNAVLEFTPLEEAQGFFSDYYKDLHGFRPRFASAEQWNSIEWLDGEIAKLRALQPIVEAEQAEMDRSAVEKFEALVAKTIAAGAKNRATALRWLRQGDDYTENDDGYFEFAHHLPYGYLRSAS